MSDKQRLFIKAKQTARQLSLLPKWCDDCGAPTESPAWRLCPSCKEAVK